MTANISNERRKQVYRRDGYQCAICGSGTFLQIHHVVPRGEGGSDYIENLVTLCSVCHAQIHGYIPFETDYFTMAEMEQALIEYMADMYADESGVWYPYK